MTDIIKNSQFSMDARKGNISSLDIIKGTAIIWIFLNHLAERIFSYPFIGNPNLSWPPLADRIRQLKPVFGHGFWGIPINIFRYIGWSGDQGVTLFLIASGFGLTWGLLRLQNDKPLALGDYYKRRAQRIYPLWIGAHLAVLAIGTIFLSQSWVKEFAFFLSILGIRITANPYYIIPAWWFIGLLLQLYLVYPLLWFGLKKLGYFRLLIFSCFCGFLIRGIGSIFFKEYLDAWLRGTIFITRLPEFVYGISLAGWLFSRPPEKIKSIKKSAILLSSLGIYSVGAVLSISLIGMTFAPFLLGTSFFTFLFFVLRRDTEKIYKKTGFLTWIGCHSYSIFLVHQPIIHIFVKRGLPKSWLKINLSFTGSILCTIIAALILEQTIKVISAFLRNWLKRFGFLATSFHIACSLLFVFGFLLGSELVMRRYWPQEPYEYSGWGERASLEPDEIFGWRLKPSNKTLLRWESYNYTVKSNSLGFPGPEYSKEKTSETFRIITTGDAFTSAEGVDTEMSWPRLLEKNLSHALKSKKVEVMNFAISGFGPAQYARVMEIYGPEYRPDLFIIGFFVNDYEDVFVDYKKVRQQIGFDLPSQDSLQSILSLHHLRRILHTKIMGRVMEIMTGHPYAYGYYLGNFKFLERGNHFVEFAGREMVEKCLGQIKIIADKIKTKVIIAMIPAPVQICKASQLNYYPRRVDLANSQKYDLDLPQRITYEIAVSLGFLYLDLRPALLSLGGDCPYHRNNMHWTSAGHAIVADYLEDMITKKFFNSSLEK